MQTPRNFDELGLSNAKPLQKVPGSFRVGAVQCRNHLKFQDSELVGANIHGNLQDLGLPAQGSLVHVNMV